MLNSRYKKRFLLGLTILAIVVAVGAPFTGMQFISLRSVLDPVSAGTDYDIFWRIRVPRVCISFLAGAGLAISGMAYQAMFRNLLATPYTLGVASGASLGAACYVHLGFMFSLLGIPGISVFAFCGAVLAVAFVYGITMLRGKRLASSTLLLAGVAISFFFSSLILFIQYLSTFAHSFQIVRWLMGAISVVGFEPVRQLTPFVLCGSLVILYLRHELNLLMAGEDLSTSRGVNVNRTRQFTFFATSLMVGGVVAVCGPIGFMGMMAPHICRLIIGADHRYLAPATLLFGGVFLTVCDTIARTIIAPAEMPVGIITALLGGPFFIWLLVGRSSDKWGMA
ncbi:MAG: iron ABC transporter permease [Desulfomonilia bacterium]|nr:iron ABC transporter permease [Deltaproteobacteria bacterium]